MVIVDDRQNLFGENGIERNEKRRQDTRHGSPEREIDFSSGTEQESENDNPQTRQSSR